VAVAPPATEVSLSLSYVSPPSCGGTWSNLPPGCVPTRHRYPKGDDDQRGGQNLSPSPSLHGRTWMIVFPERRSVGLKAATASSRVETVPMFVRSRPSRTRSTISPSWARSDSTTKSIARPSTRRSRRAVAESGDHSGQLVSGDRRCSVTVAAIGPGRGPRQLSRDEPRRMNLNDDIVYRCRRRRPLHQLHPGRSRNLVSHHYRFHGRCLLGHLSVW
jgi:hypothetical protein